MSNPYIGFSESELKDKIKWEQNAIDGELHWIGELEKKIAERKQNIETYKENIKQMKVALKYSDTVALENFLYIAKDTRSRYIGPPNSAHYYGSAYYKDFVVYKLDVFRANALDWKKSRSDLMSKDVEASLGRDYLRKQILDMCVQYDIHKIILRDVKINFKEIEKVYPYLEIITI